MVWAPPTSSAAKIYLSPALLWYNLLSNGNGVTTRPETHTPAWLVSRENLNGSGWFSIMLLYPGPHPPKGWASEIPQTLTVSMELNVKAPNDFNGNRLSHLFTEGFFFNKEYGARSSIVINQHGSIEVMGDLHQLRIWPLIFLCFPSSTSPHGCTKFRSEMHTLSLITFARLLFSIET